MFDPSKLDLDLDQNEKNKNQENKPNESQKIKENKEKIPEEKIISDGDILDEMLNNSDSQKEEIQEINITESQNEEKQEQNEEITDSKENITTPEAVQQENPSDENLTPAEEKKEVTKIENEKQQEEEEEVINYGSGKETDYDKQKVHQATIDEQKYNQEEKDKIIFDINMASINDIFIKLIEKKYDFMTVEPFDNFVKLSFRKDKVEKEVVNIKYPIYSQILIKAKTLTNLKVDVSDKSQEWKWEYSHNTKAYKISSKTAPGNFWEKLFLKLDEIENKKVKTVKKSVSFAQIMGFLGAALFAAMIIWVWFLSFILLNATSVNQLEFFQDLGVDVWSVKEFTASLVNIVFSVVLLIETLFLFTFTFKAILTKKVQKGLKIKRSIFAVFFLILTFVTASLWMILSNKINELRGQNYWKMITYDNSKYISPIFDENGSVVATTRNFIWPVTLRFDISEILNRINTEANFRASKIIWEIWETTVEKPIEETQYIHTFDEVGLHDVIIRFEWVNLAGEEEIIENTDTKINIQHLIDVEETSYSGGGIWYVFDAEDLRDLWKIEWYNIPDISKMSDEQANKTIAEALEKATNTWYQFNSRILYDEELILWMKILETWESSDSAIDKIFIYSNDANSSEIQAEIEAQADLNNDTIYTLSAKDIQTVMWNGLVDEFLWKIWDKTIRQKADQRNLESSSQIEYDFKTYGVYNIELEIIDSRGNSQTINKEITIEKKLIFTNGIFILNDRKPVANLEYNQNLHEYIIDEIWVPTTLYLNAKSVRANDRNYKLRTVEWDFQWDNDIDSTQQTVEYPVNVEGRHHILVHFVFEHIKDPQKTLEVDENIYIDGIKKEAQIDFDIKQDSTYVPVTVWFDASKSQVKDENIVAFEWDYGDGVTENRDAIVPGHKYALAGDYDVTLTVTTQTGKKYTQTKKLILKPKPQTIEIKTSMKKAPVLQGIDFLSDESEGQITAYFWDFGDGNTSTQANPTHRYTKAGIYEVKLRLDFANNNVLDKTVEIEIFEE